MRQLVLELGVGNEGTFTLMLGIERRVRVHQSDRWVRKAF